MLLRCVVAVFCMCLMALPAQAGEWPVKSEFRGLNETLDAHGVAAESLPLYMDALATEDALLQGASVYVTEEKVVDVHGFGSATGKALFVLTLTLENGVVLETRENHCTWDRLDTCLQREVHNAVKVYRGLERKHGVKPGMRIVNL